ncbi:MAG: alpha/beta hydrolase-fold protein [Pseudomonadota bacterium]
MHYARLLRVLIALLPICALSDEATEQKAASTLEISPAPLVLGDTYQYPSAIYGTPREINIYAPTLPDWGKGYFETPLPVLYVVDGGLDQDFVHLAGLSQLTLVNGERQPMIVVGVRTYERRQEISPKATDPRYQTNGFEGWGRSHQFRRHLLEEVKPFIEARYETGRSVIIGESLAGLFIVETFLEQPDAFDDYVAVSPSLWWDDRRLARQASELLEKHPDADHRLYLTMADEGGTMRLGLDEVLAALEKAPTAATVRFVDRAEDDTHSSIYHHAARDALKWLFGIAPTPYGPTPWYLEVDGQP